MRMIKESADNWLMWRMELKLIVESLGECSTSSY